VYLDGGEKVAYDKLILATGSKSNKFDWPGQDLEGVHCLYGLQDLEALERNSKDIEKAVIVGGGLIGVELAEMLISRGISVTLLVRDNGFYRNIFPQEESQIINRHIREHGVDLRLEMQLKEITGDEHGKVQSVITDTGEKIACGLVCLAVGVHPNIDLIKESPIETNKGILVNKFLQTNFQDVYAIGDCAELKNPPEGRKAIEPVWYAGMYMGRTVASHICGHPKRYHPSLWYNSAKFFDIEYQVYGNVPNDIPENMESIYWEHPNGRKCIRITFDKINKQVKGFNLLGIRYRQDVCLKWIEEEETIDEVLKLLPQTNFDPEFSPKYEPEIAQSLA